ncbi:uncharacterized protein CXorf65 homolog [Lytechinus pictus]|uniref:uncharacterized protein CXorf65 homolog n=1 Tax=Lytechinus pictus TaxID=7653 RepID=UPI0030BA2AA9
MFITVRYGDDKSELFNPNCRNVILLDNIRERCNCDEDDVIDLSDENGSVANLPGHLDDYGKNFLSDRGSFILVRVERDGDEGDDDRITYIPLLQGVDDDKDFLSRLNPKPTKGGPGGKGRRKGDRAGSPSSAKGDRRKGRQKQEPSRRSGGTGSRNTPSKR